MTIPTAALERVVLICPHCRHEWLAGLIDHATWWGKDYTAANVARTCYCPNCGTSPPMRVKPPELPLLPNEAQ